MEVFIETGVMGGCFKHALTGVILKQATGGGFAMGGSERDLLK